MKKILNLLRWIGVWRCPVAYTSGGGLWSQVLPILIGTITPTWFARSYEFKYRSSFFYTYIKTCIFCQKFTLTDVLRLNTEKQNTERSQTYFRAESSNCFLTLMNWKTIPPYSLREIASFFTLAANRLLFNLFQTKSPESFIWKFEMENRPKNLKLVEKKL